MSKEAIWTKELLDKAKALFDAGNTRAQIGQIMGFTPRAIGAALARKRRDDEGEQISADEKALALKRYSEEGYSINDVARELGRPRSMVAGFISNWIREEMAAGRILARPKHRSVPMTPEEDQRILSMRKAGMGTFDIGRAMGRAPRSVQKALKRLGFEERPEKTPTKIWDDQALADAQGIPVECVRLGYPHALRRRPQAKEPHRLEHQTQAIKAPLPELEDDI